MTSKRLSICFAVLVLSSTVQPALAQTPGAGDIVLRPGSVATMSGQWTKLADTTAAGGTAVWFPNAGAAKVPAAAAQPSSFFEITFDASAGVPYRLWMRLRAQNNYYGNDSISVQFSDAVNAAGSAIYRIGATGDGNAAKVALQETDGGVISGWGWADQTWNGLASPIYFSASGTHTIRIQQREDGVMFDQIVLSPDTFLNTPPGPQNGDNTIVPR